MRESRRTLRTALQTYLPTLTFPMIDRFRDLKKEPPKMMLGFIVRRCAADLGHHPTPDEFAVWANDQKLNGQRCCLFGKPISPADAEIMFSQPGRLVTVRPEGLAMSPKRKQG